MLRSFRIVSTTIICALVFIVGGLGTASLASAQPASADTASGPQDPAVPAESDMRAEATQSGGVSVYVVCSTCEGGGGTRVRACAPKMCITGPASMYCPPSRSGCVKAGWVRYTGYCSSSVGCFSVAGLGNFVWDSGALHIPSNLNASRKCAASLGLSIASFYATGVNSWSVAGFAMSMWGCTP